MKKLYFYLFLIFFSLLISKHLFSSDMRSAMNDELSNQNFSDQSLKEILKKEKIPEYFYEILNVIPHNINNFTEGLVVKNNILYESTGLYGYSSLQKTELTTGKLLQNIQLANNFFGEGLTLFHDKLYQLTYKENRGFVYDINNLMLKNTFSYQNEGWGLTHDEQQLIKSDGYSILTLINAESFKETGKLNVYINQIPLTGLNELEFIHEKIYANVWPTSIIVIISPKDGQVKSWFDIKSLRPYTRNQFDYVANGIAFDEKKQHLIVTGKNWPYIYFLKLKE